jgi:hypothetical protein
MLYIPDQTFVYEVAVDIRVNFKKKKNPTTRAQAAKRSLNSLLPQTL